MSWLPRWAEQAACAVIVAAAILTLVIACATGAG